MSDYEAALAYINQFINFEKHPDFTRQARLYNLDRISLLLDRLGNPHRHLKVIHVAGSKGKGSTAALIASILTQAGYRTGLFTSPHLITPRERCRIDFRPISEMEFARYVDQMKPAIKAVTRLAFQDPMRRGLEPTGAVSFFEIYTALAFSYFADCAVDFAVVEVGLGGRLDATNIVDPLVSVITPISLEHTSILGETHEAIAKEKAEIIKPNRPLVLAPQLPEAKAVFQSVAADRSASVDEVGRDIHLKRKTWNISGQTFDVETPRESYPDLFLPLLGEHQTINAATAIASVERVHHTGYTIPKASIYAGLKCVRWPGRMQVVSQSPTLLLDGAHSPTSAEALCKAVHEVFCYERLILVVGLMADKDLRGLGQVLCPVADEIIVTQAFDNPRVTPAEKIVQTWSDAGVELRACPSVREAIQLAQTIATPSDLICVTGSIILVGEAMKVLGIET
ncbi:MAG: bifunctional folylpolyglutamate synthase/dihydrofolate synthase [Candidatus Poribacteria bacterium]|nr:bifunctional folylpolyglutamate synthase/dihydrofolate synthase [Candidatus Poribacteria bacterium]